MKSAEVRSHRLQYLLKMALSGATSKQLFDRARMMGVSKSTANDYVDTVVNRVRMIREKNKKC